MNERAKAARDLSREELDRLIRRLGERKKAQDQARGPSGIQRRSEPQAPVPLSSAQERLWFLDRLVPGSAAYNVPGPVRLRGRLATAALARALREVVRRHEALRTTFEASGEEPRQVVAPSLGARLATVDLTALPEARREAEAGRLACAEARRPFSLAEGPLFRFGLLRLASRDHVLLLTLHHVVSDGWSLGVLVREISALYPAFARGEDSPLPELPIQYPDFALWQRRWLDGEEVEGHLDAWRKRLAGAPESLDLPADRPRPPVPSSRGGIVPQEVPPETVRRLTTLAREAGGTLFMALLAAFGTLLSRLSGQDDLVVGTPVANRVRVETEGLIGFFVNALPLRLEVAGAGTFRELLLRCREVATEAFAHQDLPFERLVETFASSHDLSRPPLFQVVFALQSAGPETIELPELAIERLGLHTATAKYDLSLVLRETGGGLSGGWELARDLFDDTTVGRFAASFRRLVEQVAAAPDLPLAGLDLLGAAQRQQLLVEWGDTAAAPEGGAPPVHLEVAAWAERSPDAVALVQDGGDGERSRALTYGELVRTADRLAHRLLALGVGPESVVAVCLERSVELVVAALAALRTGGAYLPVDPAYPEDRRRFMLEDSGAAALVTRRELVGAEAGSVPVLGVDRPEAGGLPVAAAGASPPPVRHDGSALAYVIYTSGSTGRPKGTLLAHGGLANLVAWHRRAYGLAPGDGAPLVAGPGFDASVWETWATLSAGATLRIPAAGTVAFAERLVGWLAARRVTVSFFPTPVAEAVLEHAGRLAGAPLRALLTGGDRLRCRAPEAASFELVNHYGPTESTVVATASRVHPSGPGAPAIGRPIANLRVHLLDRRLGPVPAGVPGELHVAGGALARGYLGRPGLSAERFVPDPFGASGGGRLYRTGDLARWLADGEIEFLGRLDHQVKVRGFRIELGEIEAVLGARHEVAAAVVTVRAAGAAGARLVAYVAPRQPEAVAGEAAGALARALRGALAETLPEYMVPQAFVVLPELPLTPNGKVDRAALPDPEGVAAGADRTYEPPRSGTEEVLAGLWQELLGVERVGRDADFFALGGHSLLATRVVTQLRAAVGVEIPLRRFFERPTVAGLAAAVEELRGAASTPPPLEPRDRDRSEGALPLSFAQERLWFLDRLEPGSPHYNVPTALRLSGSLDLPLVAAALRRIVRRHEALRTVFERRADGPRQKVLPHLPLPAPVIDLRPVRRGGGERLVEALAREEAGRPFDLASGPLVRAVVLRLGDEEHVLLLTLHHVVADGWSAGVLVKELAALYRAGREGAADALPELPVQYPDYALWQRRWLAEGELERQLGYWRGRLAGVPEVLELPADRPRPPVLTPQGRRLPLRIGPELSGSLRRLARERGASLFMVLLAGFDALLLRHTGEDDLVVGAPVANRERPEVEGLIGFFVNTLPLRVTAGGDPTYGELLERVRRVTLEAYAHQDVPFEKLVAELQPRRSRSHTPLFQVMLSFQGSELVPTLELPGLEVAPLPVRGATAKFDLTLALAETPDGGLAGILGFRPALFDDTSVTRIARRLEVLLGGAVAGADRRLSELPVLSPAEAHQVTVEASGGPPLAAEAGERPVHRLVAGWAEAAPEAVALLLGDGCLTYGELDRRVRGLAARLAAAGVRPGDRVGIALPRSFDQVAAVLAVLEAGAAYLPLDLSFPPERLAFMVADAGPRVLIARGGAPELVGGLDRPPVVLAPEPPAAAAGVAASPGPEAARGAGPELPAYVIYTSGSTGRPKGVVVTHRSLAERLEELARLFAFGPEDRQPLLASLSFDLACDELFLTLSRGASLVLVEDPAALRPLDLMAACARLRVTKLSLTSSHWHQISDELVSAGAGLPGSLRLLVTGAEAPSPEKLAELLRRAQGEVSFFNFYGPTEATISIARQPVPPDPAALARIERLPVGRPFAGSHVHLADSSLRPVPLGVAGEMCLGGSGVAAGYLHRPALTAERFVPDPWTGVAGGRLYRSGDLGRRRPGGEVEFSGRADAQVKVRGFRIELGEVEEALRSHPRIRDAAVAVRPDTGGALRLIAYVVPEPAEGVERATVTSLRAYLGERLPEFMAPSAFVFLDALPATPTGKLDRRALPEPGRERPELANAYVPPRTALERHLAALWQDVLGIDRAGLRDGFFDLGGDSIQGATLIQRLEDELGEYVYVTALFDTADLGELADYVAAHYTDAVAARFGEASLPAEVRRGREEEGERRVDEARLAELRAVIEPLPPFPPADPARGQNPRAVFVLSPPRSGSTLLRVVLAGHRHLFAPPELELLSFNTLGDRRRELSGRYSFWLEGVLRALMEVCGVSAEGARELMAEREARDQPVREFYRELQGWIGGRTLVDKTPSYTLDPEILARAEEDFDRPLYIHLTRHPYGSILSFEEARLDQLFFRYDHRFERRELAELVWTACHRNVLSFLDGIPAERRHRVRFEDLTRRPKEVIEALCGFLGLEFEDGMVEPYRETRRRMTDGIHPLAKMLGDVKFHEHRGIDAEVAERWRAAYDRDFLGGPARELAAELGYRDLSPAAPSGARRSGGPGASEHLVALRPGEGGDPLFLVHAVFGDVYFLRHLAARLAPGRPVWGLRAAGMDPGSEPVATLDGMAERYVAAIRRVQPRGPYRLAGSSLGAVVAHAMARRLCAAGDEVALLAMLDPAEPGESPPRLEGLEFEVAALQHLRGRPDPEAEARLRAFPRREERLAWILAEAQAAGALPEGFDVARLERMLNVVNAAGRALQAHEPGSFDGRALVLRAAETAARPDRPAGSEWSRYCAGGAELVVVPGGHMSMHFPPHVEDLARVLEERLRCGDPVVRVEEPASA